MKNECAAPANKRRRTKPKVVKEWKDPDVFKLIFLVEQQKCLWDARDGNYHNKIVKESAWQTIEDEFEGKFSTTDLNAKWTNLRIQYRGYAGRAKTKSGQGTLRSPKWRYYGAMNFVGRSEHKQTHQTISNFNVDDESENNSNENLMSSTPPAAEQRSIPPRRRSLSRNSPSAAAQIAESMREAVSAIKDRNQNVFDPNVNFANYLLSELKTLNEEAAASVRKSVTMFFLQCIEEERKKNSANDVKIEDTSQGYENTTFSKEN